MKVLLSRNPLSPPHQLFHGLAGISALQQTFHPVPHKTLPSSTLRPASSAFTLHCLCLLAIHHLLTCSVIGLFTMFLSFPLELRFHKGLICVLLCSSTQSRLRHIVGIHKPLWNVDWCSLTLTTQSHAQGHTWSCSQSAQAQESRKVCRRFMEPLQERGTPSSSQGHTLTCCHPGWRRRRISQAQHCVQKQSTQSNVSVFPGKLETL